MAHLIQTKFLTSLLALILILLSFIYFLEIRGEASNVLYSDYGKFYASDRFAAENQSLYTTIFFKTPKLHDPLSESRLRRMPGNLNPPFFELILYPLSLLTYKISLLTWILISIGCGFLSAVLFIKELEINSLLGKIAIIASLFAYYPVLITIQFGQVSLLLLPLIILAWKLARNHSSEKLGLILGVALNIKLFFGLFIFYFICRREWRGLICFILSAVLCAALPLLLFPFQNYLDYHLIVKNIWWYASSWNASLYGFLLRIFGGEHEKNIPLIYLPLVAKFLYAGISSVLLIALTKVLMLKQPCAKIKTDLDFSLILVSMLVLAPLNWIYYFPLLLIPFYIFFELFEAGFLPISLYLSFIFAIILGSLPFPLIMPTALTTRDIFITSGVYFYSLLLLFFVIARTKTSFSQSAILEKKYFLPTSLKILLSIIVFLPSLTGIFGIAHSLLNNDAEYKPLMIPVNPLLLELK